MITDTIQKEILVAMKARDEVKLSTYRMLVSAFNYEKIAKQHDLSDEEAIAVIASEAKKRKDAIDAYTKAGQADRAASEKAELDILEVYLPKQMDDSSLVAIVTETITELNAQSMTDMGRVIGAVMAKVKGQADGGRVSSLVKEKLTK